MTERYVINEDMIEDTLSDDYYHFNDWRDFEGLCKLANSLYNEVKPLQDEMQRRFKDFQKELNEVIEAHNNLLKENKKLKRRIVQLELKNNYHSQVEASEKAFEGIEEWAIRGH